MRTTHLVSGILMIVVSLFCLIYLIPFHTHPPQSDLDLAPSFIPNIAMATCLLTAIMLTVQAFRTPQNSAVEMHDEFGEEATGGDKRVMLNAVIWWVAAAIAGSLMNVIGFELSMMLLLAFGLYALGVRKLPILLTVAIITPILLSLGTWYLLGVQVPGFIDEFAIQVDAILASISGPAE